MRYRMCENNPNKQSNSLDVKDRYFIPLVPPHIRPNVLKSIMPHTDWIGFNLFDLRGSKFYAIAQKRGIKTAFGIGEDKKIFLTSTGKDEKLIPFYNRQNGIDQFRSDVINFDVDMAMGPDWFVYEDQPPNERKKNIRRSIELNEKCVDLENVIPNIHGTTFQETKAFIKTFKGQGKTLFVMAGRGRLINLGNRKRSQRSFSSLTSTIVRCEEIRLIITGCSSPKLHNDMPDVSGFVGLGWLIQARNRRLIMDRTYRRIFDPHFFCHDSSCCASLSKEELAKPDHEPNRAIHNLRRIIHSLTTRPKFWQCNLVN
jgi:hypothetical protein